jgi:hypothetical protein
MGIMDNEAPRSNKAAKDPRFSWSDLSREAHYKGIHLRSPALRFWEDKAKEVLEHVDQTLVIRTHVIDHRANSKLAYSLLVIYCVDEAAHLASYQTLLIEATGEKLPSKQVRLQGGRVLPLTQPAHLALDQVTHREVQKELHEILPEICLVPASNMVIPRDFPISSDAAVYELLSAMFQAAAQAVLLSQSEYTPLNLANAQGGETLELKVRGGYTRMLNTAQQPVRNDYVMELRPILDDRHANRSAPLLAQMACYVDWFAYGPMVHDKRASYLLTEAPAAPQPSVTAQLILTQMEFVTAPTLEGQLLALVAAMGFRQRVNDVMPKAPEGATVRPGVMVSLDVDYAGSNSWYNEVFAVASEGNAAAIDAIYKAADNLTNGEFFTQTRNKRPSIFGGPSIPVQTGCFVRHDEVKDIRCVDSRCIRPEQLGTWFDTFQQQGMQYSGTVPSPVNTAVREDILMETIGPSMVVTGNALRVTFSADFIKALTEACYYCGLGITADIVVGPNPLI